MSDATTTEHTHEWEVVPMQFGRYRCKVPSCVATGYKYQWNKPVQAHKVPREYGEGAEAQTGAQRKGKRGPGGW